MKENNSMNILSKLFRSEKYMNDFLDGNLYMNCLGYFKKIEASEEINTVKDSREAVTSHLQPEHVKIVLTSPEGITFGINSEDITGPIVIQDNFFNNLKICCFYSPEICFDNLEESIKSSRISAKMEKDFGSYVVIVHNFPEFIRRVGLVVDNESIQAMKFDKINYYDESFHGNFHGEEVPFNKLTHFKFQNESRLLIRTKSHDDQPLIINIGDIRDLCIVMNVEEFNRLQFLKPDMKN